MSLASPLITHMLVDIDMSNPQCILYGHDYSKKGVCERKTAQFHKNGKAGVCGAKK